MLGILAIVVELIIFAFIFFFFRKKSGAKKAMRNLAAALVIGGILTFVIPWSGGAGSTLFAMARERLEYGSFSGYLSEFAYTNTATLTDTQFPEDMKVFVMELDADGKMEVSSVNLHLPSSIKAKEPGVVTVLVRIQWVKTLVSSYPDGAGAFRNDAVISTIRMADYALLDEKTIEGGAPPSDKSSSGDRSGSMPFKDVERYVLDMLTAS